MTVTPLMGLWSGPMVMVAGDPGEVLGRGQGLGDLGAVEAAGPIHGRGQQEIAVAAQGGKGVQRFLIGRFVSLP